MGKPYLRHLKSSKDLETTYEAIRAGFVALALEKNQRATPFVDQARVLKSAASRAKTPAELVKIEEIQAGLLTAAGLSDKATKYLHEADKKEAILGLIRNFLEPAGANFVEELVFRYLLIRGDTLGGSMRNVGGFMAQCKLTRSIMAHLRLAGKAYRWRSSNASEWLAMPDNEAGIERRVRGLSWNSGKKPRTLIYNLTVPLFRNNVDLCLFNSSPEALSKETYHSASAYLALGELKGGIDPGGADEHWKTARTALGRIHEAFSEHNANPATFFIGGAIEAKMALEIWKWLEKGTLDNSANLTDEDHIASITRWLCNL
ncbi:MAG: type II restriction endonuclease [Verrucomicrobia bacterium]|nr:type II restriction endonuclease [Verrucomicrobiota bacterium]